MQQRRISEWSYNQINCKLSYSVTRLTIIQFLSCMM